MKPVYDGLLRLSHKDSWEAKKNFIPQLIILTHTYAYDSLTMQYVWIIQSNMKQCAYTFTESTMVTPSGSCEGPNVIISFLSAWRLSSLVNGISNQRFRATFVWMLRPNTWKQMCNSNFHHLLWFNHFLLHQLSWTWPYGLTWDLKVSCIYNNLVNLFLKTIKTRSLNVNWVWPSSKLWL